LLQIGSQILEAMFLPSIFLKITQVYHPVTRSLLPAISYLQWLSPPTHTSPAAAARASEPAYCSAAARATSLTAALLLPHSHRGMLALWLAAVRYSAGVLQLAHVSHLVAQLQPELAGLLHLNNTAASCPHSYSHIALQACLLAGVFLC
jgi:hypothetical protein